MQFEDVELESRPCPLGCAPDDEPILTGRDRLHGLPGEFQVVRCSGCGLMRTNPRPTPDSMTFYYPEDYGPYTSTKVESGSDRTSIRQRLSRLAKRLIDLRIDSLPPLPAGRMLEIGCASGSFLHRMSALGWQVHGIEFSESPAKAAQALGYQVHCGSLETAPAPPHAYDLIVGWMVLEHLHEPALALQKLHSWARPGARLALSVPNAGSWEFRFFKDAWYALQLPNHLYHLTIKTLASLLEQSGWRIEKTLHQRDLSNLVISCGYVLQDRRVLPRIASWLIDSSKQRKGLLFVALLPFAYLMSALGQSGRTTVWAVRKDD
jgi:2-polyprenyl-3-methyl-5-hydroxy-6-metoxy-1,4-benzoquinol methylase